jgi:polar amino acid transport system substrate-binding protein
VRSLNVRQTVTLTTAAVASAVLVLALSGIGTAGASSSTTIPTAPEDTSLAATVPSTVKTSGLDVAMDATYAPDEFIASDGKTIIGMDADLATAIGQVLGVKVALNNATFDTIIPALQSGKYNLGASSFTDTKARQKVVDFVDYFQAGEGYYVKAGSSYKPNGLAALCGHSVAVESGTTEQTDAQTQAKACKKKGKGAVKVLTFQDQTTANVAVSSGRANVGFADSQVAEYIVAQSNGQFMNSGTAFEVAPYGLALPKGLGLTRPVDGAVGQLMHDGIYQKILKKWGIQAGAISRPEINGATS